MIGSLICLDNMRLNILFHLNTLSQFLTYPIHVHLVVAKPALRYLKGIVEYEIKYDAN